MRLKIGGKLILFGTAIIVVPLVFLAFFITVESRIGITRQTETDLVSMAQSMADYVDVRLQSDMRVAASLALHPLVVEAAETHNRGKPTDKSVAAASGALAALRSTDEFKSTYESFVAIGKDGIIVAASNPAAVGLNVRERDYFKSAMTGKISAGQMFLSKTGVITVGISAPIRGGDGSIAGVCAITLLTDSISAEMKKSKLGETGYYGAIDRAGLMVFHPNPEMVLKFNMLGDPELRHVAERVLSENHGTLHYEYKGSKKALAFATVPTTGWAILANIPESEFLATSTQLRDMIIWITLLATALAIVLFAFFSRSISKPLGAAANYARMMASGDLVREVSLAFRNRGDEIGTLAETFELQREKISVAMGSVTIAADGVAQGSLQLSSTSQQLSQGATEQASSLEEISSSMEEMTANIRQNAENAQTTEALAKKSAVDAEIGGKAVTEAVEAMKAIAAKTGLIEEIARSTNMLALNASIEAARAGDYGKGFAVVAAEVGKLAERSQKEAGEISALSSRSLQIAETAGSSIVKLIPDILRTSELVQEISASSNEQSAGAQQINQALSQLDSVVQQNASAAEESASMAEELANQSAELKSALSYFKISEEFTRGRGGAEAREKSLLTDNA